MPAGELEKLIAQHAGPYRERIYGPLRTLSLFIGQALSADGACQDAVARNLSERTARGRPGCTLNTGPYCKARQRLRLELVLALLRVIGRRLERLQPVGWRWQGRSVKLVDGTTVSMPDTPANQAVFPQNRAQQPGLGFPLARVVAIFSLGTGAVLDWAMGPCQGSDSGEEALFRQQLTVLDARDIVLADQLYCSYWTLAALQARGIDLVMRGKISRQCDFRRGKRLGRGDHIVQWMRPQRPSWMDKETYAALPDALIVREVRINRRVLVTTLLDPGFASAAELERFYASRWNVEVDLRTIKAESGMDILRCKTPEMARKEVAVHLLSYTLVRAVMAQAASLGQVLARALSFRGATQLLNAYHQQLRHSAGARVRIMTAHVLGALSALRLARRPDRVEPRAIKRRPKPHQLLSVPRPLARLQILAQRSFAKVVP